MGFELAPPFTLPDQSGAMTSLRDYLYKKWVVLFFYPKNHTPFCRAQACAFRDNYEAFQKLGAEVLGVSSDSIESHQKFLLSNHLPFKLLSDPGGTVAKAYGVTKTAGLIPGRVTYVIDPQGVIQHSFNSQFNTGKHISEALRILELSNQ